MNNTLINNYEDFIWLYDMKYGECKTIQSTHHDFALSLAITFCHFKSIGQDHYISVHEPQGIGISIAILYKGEPKYYDEFICQYNSEMLFEYVKQFIDEPLAVAIEYEKEEEPSGLFN